MMSMVTRAAGRRDLVTLLAATLAWAGVWLVPEARGENTPADAKQQQAAGAAARLFASIPWQKGPCNAELGAIATLRVPEKFAFTGREGARAWAELNHNPPDDRCLGVLLPRGTLAWFLIFDYDEVGYVKDDEKDRLDADQLLASLKAGTEKSNAYRRSKGWPDLSLTGWEYPPHYDDNIKRLVWATRYQSAGQSGVNYNIRILGRGGVIRVVLVTEPERLAQDVPATHKILGGFTFKEGQRYAEWHAGDRVAEYGLAGLIAGGGTAVAAKMGLLAYLGKFLAKLWSLVVAAVGGVVAWFKRLFARRESV